MKLSIEERINLDTLMFEEFGEPCIAGVRCEVNHLLRDPAWVVECDCMRQIAFLFQLFQRGIHEVGNPQDWRHAI